MHACTSAVSASSWILSFGMSESDSLSESREFHIDVYGHAEYLWCQIMQSKYCPRKLATLSSTLHHDYSYFSDKVWKHDYDPSFWEGF